MKTIGLLGGMSWESTQSYYQALNQGVKATLGGLHSAKICLYSVDFADLEQWQHQGQWQTIGVHLAASARRVEAAGADFLLICTNTMHKVLPQIEAEISIPVLHIADATALRLKADGMTKVGLLGTRFTMEQDFYKGRLAQQHSIEVLVPSEAEQRIVHQVIYDELCQGQVNQGSRQHYLRIIDNLYQQGAQAVILGCTEIALLVQQQHCTVPLYDTTQIHAEQAVRYALDEKF